MQIPERFGHELGLAEVVQQLLGLSKVVEGDLKVEPEVDGLLARFRALGQMRHNAKCLLEVSHSLPTGVSRHGFRSGLPQIAHRMLPQSTVQRVMSEALGLLAEPIPVKVLDSLHDPSV